MTERSGAMLNKLQNGRNLGELEAFESVYEDDMNKSLGDSLKYKMTFVVKSECRDEMAELKERIETVVNNKPIRF